MATRGSRSAVATGKTCETEDSCYDWESVAKNSTTRGLLKPVLRAVIEIAFIVFLFYSNLLMGEFTVGKGQGKSFAYALNDIFTGTNFLIAMVSAFIGYVVFESLRRKF